MTLGRPLTPSSVLFWSHVKKDSITGCWNWTAYLDKDGYGKFHPLGTKIQIAHRYSLLLHGISLKDDLQVDHLCKNKKCVNPYHLEQVDCNTNLKRAENNITTINSKKINCKRGHLLDGYNLLLKKGNKRTCRTCENLTERQRKSSKRLARVLLIAEKVIA